MDKALGLAKTSATGGFHLFFGRSIATIIMAIGTIVMGAVILESDYGLYTIAIIPSSTLMLFLDWGVDSAVARECARCRAENKEIYLKKALISSITFGLTTGVLLMLISLLTANYAATVVFDKPEATYLIAFASINILATSIFTIARSILVGFEKMKLVSLVLICQGIVQCVVGPLLVFWGFGAFGALIGFTTGSIAASAISIMIVYFTIIRKFGAIQVSNSDIIKTLKPMLKYGIPLAVAAIVSGLLFQISSFLMAMYVDDLALIGNYKIAANFALLIGFFSNPIITVLFPTFSKLKPKDEPEVTRSVLLSSIKYSALLIVPATMTLIVLSGPIIGTLYGAKWSVASSFLILTVLSNLFVVFGNISVPNFLSALGHTNFVMALNLVGITVGIPLMLILIPSLGISGMLIGAVVSGLPSIFISLHFLRKQYNLKIDLIGSSRIIISSATAALAAYGFVATVPVAYWLKLIVGFLIYLVVYIVSAPFIGAVNKTDLRLLKVIFNDLGIASKFIEIPINLMERILTLKTKQKHSADDLNTPIVV